ncbi:MAG: ABC transporter permease, partial [Gammaproteobacteria bacterium]|nr:ABC transporter permease [Gammaproteobacteria bacterium]
MIRPLELFIGLRYTRARRRNHFISFISTVSILGVSIGVWALITVLSIMNGFEKELKARILSAASHVTVSAAGGGALVRWRELAPVL